MGYVESFLRQLITIPGRETALELCASVEAPFREKICYLSITYFKSNFKEG